MLQLHIEPPLSPVNVSPLDIAIVTVTVPDVGPAFAAFVTATVKAELWPCTKVVTDSVMDRPDTFRFVSEKVAGVGTPVTAAVTE
jgi:hypothetical protein